MKLLTLTGLVALTTLTDCVNDLAPTRTVQVNTETPFHLCTSLAAAQDIFRAAREMNYWIALNRIDNDSACPAYRMRPEISVSVVSRQVVNSGPYSEIVFFELNDTNLGKRYGSYFISRYTGQADGSVIAIIDQRTNDGLNWFMDELLSGN